MSHSHRSLFRGFTLIELVVTIAIVAVLAALAAPSMRDYTVRNQLSAIGSEFSGSVLRARNEAVSKNTCTTMCISTTFDNASPSCATTGQDWQVGWILFLNPSCSSSLNSPAIAEDMILVRRPTSADYALNAQTSGRRKLFFNARGNSSLSGANEFDLQYLSPNNALSLKYAFNICIDSLGRTRNISGTSSC
jgi:type IV fimbrial biogenesis protein FimT